MADNKSLDNGKVIAALITDVYTSYGCAFNTKVLRLNLKKVSRRIATEGLGFLTKTLPRLGKALDKALAEDKPLNCTELRLKTQPGSKLPMLFGELFNRVLNIDGTVLSDPCVISIKHLRQLLYLYYKYELPYSLEQEQHVLCKFERTEKELDLVSERLRLLGDHHSEFITYARRSPSAQKAQGPKDQHEVIREAKILLSELFAFFDPKNILPRHGPGAVATKQRLWDKYRWTNVSAKIRRVYAVDEYFFSSLTHVSDRIDQLKSIDHEDLPARVLLVPKDSRGPRLISCEPVDYQWVQQGLGAAIVALVEGHALTKHSVFFTDQVPNRVAAQLGSYTGKYATLDLNEASDRVSLDLVRLLFPPHIYEYLESCRSSSTLMPDGLVLPLLKFAPMGSCLCFPIMALTIWAILTAALTDTTSRHSLSRNRSATARQRRRCLSRNWEQRESIHVYGDDVIVPTAQAADAIEHLESFGLKVNRDKSCIKGFFRESCGMDAYKGVDVTPVRLRTVWSSLRSPDSYASWIAYANSFWLKGHLDTYNYIVGVLHSVYGEIPTKAQVGDSAPSLHFVHDEWLPSRRRTNRKLQKLEWKVWCLKASVVHYELPGWSMLLRYYTEGRRRLCPQFDDGEEDRESHWGFDLPSSHGGVRSEYSDETPFSVRSYTRRGISKLVLRWR